MLPALLAEPFRKANFATPVNSDESVNSLISRRFGTEFARQFLSAFVHGIYAADANQLSVQATFPFLLEAERRGGGSIVRGMLMSALYAKKETKELYEYQTGDVDDILKGIAMFTFKGGIQTLSNAIVNDLQARPNVNIHTGADVRTVTPRPGGITVRCSFHRQLLSKLKVL